MTEACASVLKDVASLMGGTVQPSNSPVSNAATAGQPARQSEGVPLHILTDESRVCSRLANVTRPSNYTFL